MKWFTINPLNYTPCEGESEDFDGFPSACRNVATIGNTKGETFCRSCAGHHYGIIGSR